MSVQADKLRASLARRVKYVLKESRHSGHREISCFANEFRKLGEVVIIGGMLRDLALGSSSLFKSDVDFVVDPFDQAEFDKFVIANCGKINRFGGYSILAKYWKVDVWSLRQTWAHRAGHVQVQRFENLLETTFFNCDAIIFDVNKGKLIFRECYFEQLRDRILEINLCHNPNPLGNGVRALRYAYTNGFRFGESLARHVLWCIEHYGTKNMIEYEKNSFGSYMLQRMPLLDVEARLRASIGMLNLRGVDPLNRQLSFKGF